MDSCDVCEKDDATVVSGTTTQEERDEISGNTRGPPPAQKKRKRSLGDTETLPAPKTRMQPESDDARTAKVDASKQKLAPTDYTIGWICALSTEYVAAQVFLDERHEGPEHIAPNDNNDYTLGKIGSHNVVIAVLPNGEYGISSATGVAKDMLHSFPNIKVGLMVGIGGGAPSKKHDIRLGDVVVSAPRNGAGGVFQYDFGKAIQDGAFNTTGFLNQPPPLLRTAVNGLETHYEINGHQLEEAIGEVLEKKPRLRRKYERPQGTTDRLYQSSVLHLPDSDVDCADCCGNDSSKLVLRPERTAYDDNPQIHYGLIASANQVMKDALIRDELAREKDVLCFEMEAAGLMNQFPCLVIRGICDYADSHKSRKWQGYAAMTAAAYAKDLLRRISPRQVKSERRIMDVLSVVADVQKGVDMLLFAQQNKDHERFLDWLTPVDYAPQQRDYMNIRQPKTGRWFLSSEEFQTWISFDKHTLFCPGGPGAGKTIMTAAVIDELHTRYRDEDGIGIAYIYCDYRRQYEQKANDLLANLVKQLIRNRPAMPDRLQGHYERSLRPSLEELSETLREIGLLYTKVFVVVDALDECQLAGGCLKTFLSALFELQKSTNINIFATARFVPEIIEQFKHSSSLNISAKKEDVQDYVAANMGRLPSFVVSNLALQDEIKNTITEAADGMFLIVRLNVDSLTQLPTIGDVKRALRKLPSSLGETYDQAMARIEAQGGAFRRLARRTLSWLIYAKTVLSVLELQHAVAIEPGTSEFDEDFIPDKAILGSICAGLVTFDVESGNVRLAHYTIKEYFGQEGKHWFQHAETDIARACLTCLSFHASWGRTPVYFCSSLVQYAATQWGHHARGMPERQLMSSILDLLRDGAKLSAARRWLDAVGPSAIHVAVHFELEDTIMTLIRLGHDINDPHAGNWTPLLQAVRAGCTPMVQLLLNAGAKFVAYNYAGICTPLTLASALGREDIVELFLEHGADPGFAPLGDGWSALSTAILKGYSGIVKLLLEKGANANTTWCGNPVLFYAVRSGDEGITGLLLENGADANSTLGDPLLQLAIQSGRQGIARLLVTNGADVNATIMSTGECLLSTAVRNNAISIVKLLLENGANVEGTSALNGATPLYHAMLNRSESIVRLLLEYGAEVKRLPPPTLFMGRTFALEGILRLLLDNGLDANFECCGWSLLSWAVELGHEGTAKLLREHGAA
ncbi:hypothetical protein HDV57DRAFT_209273 [Trichoderma longibrachiatum]